MFRLDNVRKINELTYIHFQARGLGILFDNIGIQIVDLDGHTIIIKGVLANTCNQCGEYFIENDIAIKIEKIIEEVTKNKIEILVLNYSEMAA